MIDYNVKGEVIFTEWNGFKMEIYIKNLETNKNFWTILNNIANPVVPAIKRFSYNEAGR